MDISLNAHSTVVVPVTAEVPGPNGYARAEAYCLDDKHCGWSAFGRATTVIALAVDHDAGK